MTFFYASKNDNIKQGRIYDTPKVKQRCEKIQKKLSHLRKNLSINQVTVTNLLQCMIKPNSEKEMKKKNFSQFLKGTPTSLPSNNPWKV